MEALNPIGDSRRAVRRAVILLVFSEFLLADIRAGLSWYAASWAVPFVVSGIGGVCTALLLWRIYQGRDWARTTFALLAGLGFAFWLVATPGTFANSKVDWFLAAAQYALRGWAAVLLFKSPGSGWFEGHPLRHASVIASSLFTIALLWFVPIGIRSVTSGHGGDETDLYRTLYFHELHNSGSTMLAIVLIGLIVTWTAYANKVRWSWLVMFAIVWGWVFPAMAWQDFVRPLLHRGLEQTPSLPMLLMMGISSSGQERGFSQEVLVFGLMLAGLVLPMKAFFWSADDTIPQPDALSRA